MPHSRSSRPSAAARHRKQHGVHYTPVALADFLARVTLAECPESAGGLAILDPACGDGALLAAAARLSPGATLTGYEKDASAVSTARDALTRVTTGIIEIHHGDFLDGDEYRGATPSQARKPDPHNGVTPSQAGKPDLHDGYDVVIANPPYVRTQALGAARSRELAARFGLTGRVDLYQAFARAATNVLRPGGVLGLLTSNRFLSVRAGAALRELLRTDYEIRAVFDLGDTRLFQAAVLPVVVVAVRGRRGAAGRFVRVYRDATEGERRMGGGGSGEAGDELFTALMDSGVSSVMGGDGARYGIERGVLASEESDGAVWRLSRSDYEDWLARVARHTAGTFGDFAKIRVGIKTTADAVFVRSDWDELPESKRPEGELLRPLITHREAERWRVDWKPGSRRVLYPYCEDNGRFDGKGRHPISLRDFPKAGAYLKEFEERLRNRRYVLDSGRQWYEIWVPHRPALWARPKIVFPDISERGRFALDESGAVVQGDCYWMILREGADSDWLWLMLAVANSRLITRFYDIMFHNKLYAGRRRFMTQYVERFPLPRRDSDVGRALIAAARELAGDGERRMGDGEMDRLVEEAFGVG